MGVDAQNEFPIYQNDNNNRRQPEYLYRYQSGDQSLFLIGSTVGATSGGILTRENVFCPYDAKKWKMYYKSTWTEYNLSSYCENCCQYIMLVLVWKNIFFAKINVFKHHANIICHLHQHFPPHNLPHIIFLILPVYDPIFFIYS